MDDTSIVSALALYSAVRTLDADAAVTAARRVALADLVLAEHDHSPRAIALLACLLADLGAVVRRDTTAASTAQTASIVAGVQGLGAVSAAIANRHERIDGAGTPGLVVGPQIPDGARLLAVVDVLVGRDPGGPVDWETRIEEVKDAAGAALDPGLVRRAHAVVSVPEARNLIDAADAEHAVAVVSRLLRPAPGLAGIADLLDRVHDPRDLARALVLHAWRSGSLAAVGCRVCEEPGGPLETELGAIGTCPNDVVDAMVARVGIGSVVEGNIVVVPVGAVGRSRPWGALWGVATEARIDDAERASLELIAGGLGAAVERQRRESELAAHALRDPLTGLANRRFLEVELSALFEQPRAARADTALVMCDVDGLKRVNDTRGHAAGDDVLRAVARVLETVVDGVDGFAARLGGDEFCLVIRSGGILRAQEIASLATSGVGASVAGDVGLSCGIAYGARADTPGALLSGADVAQYEVKRRRPGGLHGSEAVPGRRRRRDH